MIASIQFAGHSAVFLSTSTMQIAIDPWLEGNPSCPDRLKNPEKLDLIVLTHGHSDHASDVVRLHKQTGAKVIAMFELAMILGKEGVDPKAVIGTNKGGTTKFEDISITFTHAFHSSSYDSAERGTLYAGEPCGVVVQDGKNSLFHAGDTALFSDLKLIGSMYKPSLAFLPIGDCYTMGGAEAAEAAKLLGVKKAIPIHYKTFPVLDQNAEKFTAACRSADIEVIELAPGQSFDIKSV